MQYNREIEDLIYTTLSLKRYSKMHTNRLGVTYIEHDDMGVIAEDNTIVRSD